MNNEMLYSNKSTIQHFIQFIETSLVIKLAFTHNLYYSANFKEIITLQSFLYNHFIVY